MKKVSVSIIIIALLLLSVTWFYQIVWTIALVVVWRKKINEIELWGRKREWMAKAVVGVLVAMLWYVAPRYRVGANDRVKLVYQDKEGKPITPPVSHYVAGCIIQEAEVEGIMTKLTSILPVGEARFLNEYKESGLTWRESTRWYRELESEGIFALSGCLAQATNMKQGTDTRSVYLVLPKEYDKNKKYPLVVFCHGHLGNWQMYAGMTKDFSECVSLHIGTRDLSGMFHKAEIAEVFGRQKRFLDEMGVSVDWDAVHLIGLSNGGSASNIAHSHFGNKFKSVTYLSTGIHAFSKKRCAVYIVGGGRDMSSGNCLSAHKKLKANGSECDLYWNKNANHFLLMTDWDELRGWLEGHYIPNRKVK